MSKYFQLEQFLRSGKAQALGGAALKEQQNPPADVRYNIEQLATNVLDKIRERWNAPIYISSGYRCPTVNSAVGGSKTSQHCNGQAADFSAATEAQNKQLMQVILQMVNDGYLDVDQIINEYPKANGTPDWIHVSYKANGKNRNSFLVIGNKSNNVFGSNPLQRGAVVKIDEKAPQPGANVFATSNPNDNAINLNNTLTTGSLESYMDPNAKFKYRIYQEFAPTLVVDELSLKPNDKNGFYEPENSITSKDRPRNENEIATMGKTYPFIRINDYYFNIEEIEEMTIDHYGFVPTISLTVTTWNKALLKTEIIKEGDICAVYCAEDQESVNNEGERTGESLIRPLRCDFRITHVFFNEVDLRYAKDGLKIIIYGEMNIPDLHNANMNFSYSGTSRDALRETAKQLKLGFCFNNPDNTNDTQIWQCQPTEKSGPAEFIKDVTMHSWFEEHHFFDSWIEPHYNLCFIDINKQLGWEGLDDGIDIAAIKNTLINAQNDEGTLLTPKYDSSTNNPFFAKMFHNIHDNILLSNSSYKVKKYTVINKATSITRQIGLIRKAEQSLNNAGLYEENNIEHLEYKLAINWDKVGNPQNGKKGSYYVLDGPGQPYEYVSSEPINGPYSEKEVSKKPEEILDVQSTGDDKTIESSGTNELASGNMSASYQVAFDHNLLNNMQLDKQYVEIICRGNNQGIMRGEKVPCFLIDHAALENATAGLNPTTQIYSHIEVAASGWFIIDGIKWHYKKNLEPEVNTTNWETIVKLTRREWPIPKYIQDESSENNEKESFNAAGGSVVESTQENTQTDDITLNKEEKTQTPEEAKTVPNEPAKVTTDGLESYMKELWYYIADDIRLKDQTLISGKRWFIDENKNKLDFWDGRTVDGFYEIMNSDGTVGYYEKRDSQHLFGKAIDFITSNGKVETFEIIAQNEHILEIMFKNNLIMQEEKYSNLNTSHFDICFNESYIKRNAWWTYVYKQRNNQSSFTVEGRTVDFGIYVLKNES